MYPASRRWFIVCVFSALLLQSPELAAQQAITAYKIYYAAGRYTGGDGNNLLALRQFTQNGRQQLLVVDPASLQTAIVPARMVKINQVYNNWSQLLSDNSNTAYIHAIDTARRRSAALQDAGIAHGYAKEKGITLTVDLCPSHKPLDRIIFTSLIAEFKKTEQPVPLALSITGRFLLSHQDDINWLKTLDATKEISITWINHTYNHNYNPKAPLKNNFLLQPGTDMNFELLGTEVAMLQNGLLPSVFFRFPGLVSEQRLVDSVISYGLIPIGSDAWLAKGQPANAGSIVLIHGNGNEPVGVKDFVKLLHTQQQMVMDRQWLMYDLRESVEDEFK